MNPLLRSAARRVLRPAATRRASGPCPQRRSCDAERSAAVVQAVRQEIRCQMRSYGGGAFCGVAIAYFWLWFKTPESEKTLKVRWSGIADSKSRQGSSEANKD